MSCCCVLPSLNFSNSGLTVVVSGIVRNTSGNTVSGAVVYLSSSPPTNDRVPQNIISKTTSNSSGAYVFNNLNPGNYYVGFAVYGSPYLTWDQNSKLDLSNTNLTSASLTQITILNSGSGFNSSLNNNFRIEGGSGGSYGFGYNSSGGLSTIYVSSSGTFTSTPVVIFNDTERVVRSATVITRGNNMLTGHTTLGERWGTRYIGPRLVVIFNERSTVTSSYNTSVFLSLKTGDTDYSIRQNYQAAYWQSNWYPALYLDETFYDVDSTGQIVSTEIYFDKEILLKANEDVVVTTESLFPTKMRLPSWWDGTSNNPYTNVRSKEFIPQSLINLGLSISSFGSAPDTNGIWDWYIPAISINDYSFGYGSVRTGEWPNSTFRYHYLTTGPINSVAIYYPTAMVELGLGDPNFPSLWGPTIYYGPSSPVIWNSSGNLLSYSVGWGQVTITGGTFQTNTDWGTPWPENIKVYKNLTFSGGTDEIKTPWGQRYTRPTFSPTYADVPRRYGNKTLDDPVNANITAETTISAPDQTFIPSDVDRGGTTQTKIQLTNNPVSAISTLFGTCDTRLGAGYNPANPTSNTSFTQTLTLLRKAAADFDGGSRDGDAYQTMIYGKGGFPGSPVNGSIAWQAGQGLISESEFNFYKGAAGQLFVVDPAFQNATGAAIPLVKEAGAIAANFVYQGNQFLTTLEKDSIILGSAFATKDASIKTAVGTFISNTFGNFFGEAKDFAEQTFGTLWNIGGTKNLSNGKWTALNNQSFEVQKPDANSPTGFSNYNYTVDANGNVSKKFTGAYY